ncbi:MAG: GspH/FimT family pseudopilin [Pseudomonadota bacterium]
MDRSVALRRRASGGFTLVELLVVMLIVAMISSVVVLNMPPPAGNEKNEADVFAARLDAAAELAIMTGSMIGLELDPGGYVYYRYNRGVWTAMSGKTLSSGTFPPDLAVEFTLTDPAKKNETEETEPLDEEAPAPSVFFAPTGETTPLEADFKSRRGNITVTLDAAGAVTMASP